MNARHKASGAAPATNPLDGRGGGEHPLERHTP